eukprot:COSAG02_NODE_2520_length_8610_cov_4.542474_7_plen_176_part_00
MTIDVSISFFNQLAGKRRAGNVLPSKDEDGNWLGDEEATAAFLARYWAAKVAAAERESGRESPADLTPTQDEIEACVADLTQHEEVVESLLSLGKGKACGWDGISARVLALGAVTETLVRIIQQIWIEEHLPPEMVQGALIMLFKGGGKKKDDPASYRPVILLPHAFDCNPTCLR